MTLRDRLVRVLVPVAAWVLLIEEWLWDRTSALLERIGRWPPFAAFGRWIARQPPYRALALFALPVLVVLPAKEIAIVAVLHGRIVLALALLLAEKVLVTAIFARLWQLTEPAITRIDRVRRARDAFLRLRARLYGWLHAQPAYRRARALVLRLRRHGLLRRIRAEHRRQRDAA